MLRTSPPAAAAERGGGASAEFSSVCRSLMQEIFASPQATVGLARQWLYDWLERQQSSPETGARLLADLLYHTLLCPTELEMMAYVSSATSNSIALQLLGPIDHATPRVFSLQVDCRSSRNLGLLCLMIIGRHQTFFGEMTSGVGLCRSVQLRRCLFNREADAHIDRLGLCGAMFRLFLLGGLSESNYDQALETGRCALRYLREMLEMRGSRAELMQRAHAMCLDLEMRLDDWDGVLIWLAEFVATYACVEDVS